MSKHNLGKKTIVTPLPVLIVATYDETGKADAMNVAWGGQCTYNHVALNLAKVHKTTENIRQTVAFTVSIANLDNLVVSDYFGVVSGRKEDKIAVAGVHIHKSEFVNAPVIEEYPLTLECNAVSIEDCFGEVRVVGEVVNTIADNTILDSNGNVDFDKLQPLSFDSCARSYRVLGKTVSTAFNDGKTIKHEK